MPLRRIIFRNAKAGPVGRFAKSYKWQAPLPLKLIRPRPFHDKGSDVLAPHAKTHEAGG